MTQTLCVFGLRIVVERCDLGWIATGYRADSGERMAGAGLGATEADAITDLLLVVSDGVR